MNKDYAISTAQDFKTVGKRLLKDYEQNISNISKDLDKELYSFLDIVIDNYITKCVKARQNVFDTTLKAHNVLQWLIKQKGFIKSFGETLDNYLKEITKEQVTKLFTQDILPRTFFAATIVYGYKINEKEIQADCKKANKKCLMVLNKIKSNLTQEITEKQQEQFKQLFDKYNFNKKDKFIEQLNRFNKAEKERFFNEVHEISPFIAFSLYYPEQIKGEKILSFDELIN